jgi:hypothetical protein
VLGCTITGDSQGGNLTLEKLDGTRLREEMDKNEREKLESCRETADG